MAIELGTKVVIDTAEYNDYAVGISLPIQNDFSQTFNTSDQIKSNIKNLLLTKKGERILQPEFGSDLHSVLFEFNDDNLEPIIEQVVTEAMERWLPFVTIDEIIVESTNELKDNNTVNISMKFSIGENPQLNEVTFTVGG
jgi:phage baseplate assembly protein W